MRNILLIMTLGFLVGCAHSDPWTKQDTIMQSVVTATMVIDAMQTTEIQYLDNHYEAGFARHVLGAQPKTSETWQYFGSIAISNYLISRALPAKWRPYWQGAIIAVQLPPILNNCSNGLGPLCD